MRRQHAFTLIELMVTLAVLAIVLMVAVPSFNTQIQNNRSLAIGEDLATALNFARSEAVKRGRAVTLCASNGAQDACTNDASAWVNGWLVVLDGNTDTAGTATASDVLRVWDAPPDNASIVVERAATFGGTGTASAFVRYTGRGALARIGNTVGVARLRAHTSGCTGNSLQQLNVGVAGTVNVVRASCPE